MKYGYVNHEKCIELNQFFNAYIDGKKIDGVIEADDIDGHVIVASKDDKGNYLVKNGELEYTKIVGNVELVPL